ncbi:hypothetical protein J7J90_03105 [Candidatus Micrarchaeota archaeon]|nr:hypothetical protein [Candidatus Micrarchaeota archaeon]
MVSKNVKNIKRIVYSELVNIRYIKPINIGNGKKIIEVNGKLYRPLLVVPKEIFIKGETLTPSKLKQIAKSKSIIKTLEFFGFPNNDTYSLVQIHDKIKAGEASFFEVSFDNIPFFVFVEPADVQSVNEFYNHKI